MTLAEVAKLGQRGEGARLRRLAGACEVCPAEATPIYRVWISHF